MIRTVKDLVDLLMQFDPNLPIGFCTSPAQDFEVLSVYSNTPATEVWVDLEEKPRRGDLTAYQALRELSSDP